MKRVLFVCTGNSCRSQMAEGLLRHLGNERFQAFSAGTNPSTVHPLAIKAMDELEVDISGQASKGLEVFSGKAFDNVITVCDLARESCSVFPGEGRQLHWSFEDPAEAGGSEEERMDVFRSVRDQIRQQIERFLTEP